MIDLDQWFPARIRSEVGGALSVEWVFLGDLQFSDAFMEDTFRRAELAGIANGNLVTGIDDLRELARCAPSLTLRGLIFHTSRCGSTLISRSLAQLPRFLVVSQPEALSDVLDCSELVDADRIGVLQDLVTVMGRQRRGEQEFLVLKATSHWLFHLDLLKRAFPDMKRIFVFRDPLEIMVSVLRSPTAFLRMKNDDILRAQRLLGYGRDLLASMGAEEYVARILGRFYEIVYNELRGSAYDIAIGIDYRSLPEAIWNAVLPHLDVKISLAETMMLQHFVGFDAKAIGAMQVFHNDSKSKRQSASVAIQGMASAWAKESYRQLREYSRDRNKMFRYGE